MAFSSGFRSRKAVWIFGFLALCSQYAILLVVHDVGSPAELLRLQTTLSPEKFQRTIQRWGEVKYGVLLSHYYIDFLHPVLYSLFLSACLSQFQAYAKRPYVLALPFVAGVFDEIENLSQLSVLLGRVPVTSPVFYVGAISAWMKWLLVAATLALILSALLAQLRSVKKSSE